MIARGGSRGVNCFDLKTAELSLTRRREEFDDPLVEFLRGVEAEGQESDGGQVVFDARLKLLLVLAARGQPPPAVAAVAEREPLADLEDDGRCPVAGAAAA